MENDNVKEEKEHLTITELEHFEKATDICHKIGVGSAILSGITFLAGSLGIVITVTKAYPLWQKILGYVLSFGSLGCGMALAKFSHYALNETQKYQKDVEKEKEYHRQIGK